MTATIQHAIERGVGEHGWLHSRHSFSFANYRNPDRMGFGRLRVLNDDVVEGGMGFGMHSHENMEIVSIPLRGSLEHEDSEGHKYSIGPGEIQAMSAGRGIYHSEYNGSKNERLEFLQIWIETKEEGIDPRYDQRRFGLERNRVNFVASGDKSDHVLYIHQDAYISLLPMDVGKNIEYKVRKNGNGLYVFLIEGGIRVGGQKIGRRDAIDITDESRIGIEADEDSTALLIEVPM